MGNKFCMKVALEINDLVQLELERMNDEVKYQDSMLNLASEYSKYDKKSRREIRNRLKSYIEQKKQQSTVNLNASQTINQMSQPNSIAE
jgi:hypothetical protein